MVIRTDQFPDIEPGERDIDLREQQFPLLVSNITIEGTTPDGIPVSVKVDHLSTEPLGCHIVMWEQRAQPETEFGSIQKFAVPSSATYWLEIKGRLEPVGESGRLYSVEVNR